MGAFTGRLDNIISNLIPIMKCARQQSLGTLRVHACDEQNTMMCGAICDAVDVCVC